MDGKKDIQNPDRHRRSNAPTPSSAAATAILNKPFKKKLVTVCVTPASVPSAPEKHLIDLNKMTHKAKQLRAIRATSKPPPNFIRELELKGAVSTPILEDAG